MKAESSRQSSLKNFGVYTQLNSIWRFVFQEISTYAVNSIYGWISFTSTWWWMPESWRSNHVSKFVVYIQYCTESIVTENFFKLLPHGMISKSRLEILCQHNPCWKETVNQNRYNYDFNLKTGQSFLVISLKILNDWFRKTNDWTKFASKQTKLAEESH